MITVTAAQILKGLYSLGIKPGFKILVHSSLSSFGHVEGGADSVIDALIESVSPGGTILVPTFTGSERLSRNFPPVFHPNESSCWTGTIPETFRKRPNAIRSVHPTHSVAAIGSDAEKLTNQHIESITPCDRVSPFGKLASLEDSFVLLIGVSHESSTMFHHIEEIAGCSYHIQKGFAKSTLILEFGKKKRHYMLHRYGTPRNFSVMEPVFVEREIQKKTEIGKSEVRIVKIKEMVDLTLRSIQANKRILCKNLRLF
jgi:aminoglycoside 3-N-acetyltransferase